MSDCLTPNTTSDPRYVLSESKMWVLTLTNPSADTMQWMCAGRHGCRPVAWSILPTGPSSGMG